MAIANATATGVSFANVDLLNFVKLYYAGEQASCGVRTDTYPVNEDLYISGAALGPAEANPAIYYVPVFDPYIQSVDVESSEDDGASWQTVAQKSTSTTTIAVLAGQLYESGKNKLVRIRHGVHESPAMHVPLTF